MTFNQSVIQSVGILIFLILGAWFLRNIKLLKEDYGKLFAKLITNITLPALIFTALSTNQFEFSKIILAVVMIISQILCALIAWLISNLLKLSRPRKGALILASTFSSSGFMGYAIVKEIYVKNNAALSDAAVVSELGVATVIFTLGVIIAINFGIKENKPKDKFKEGLKFFYSPIFFALVLGIIVSFLPVSKDKFFINGFYRILKIVSQANTFLVVLTLGVMLHFKKFWKVIFIVLTACFIKLILQPFFAYSQSLFFNFPTLWHQIVVLEAAMPTAALTAVFAKKYGCDSELTSILIFTTFISSIFTIITMILLLG